MITGASSGIGEAAARRIAREPGSSLVLVARRQQRLRSLAEALGAQRSSWLAVDLTDEVAPAQIHDHVRERHGRKALTGGRPEAAEQLERVALPRRSARGRSENLDISWCVAAHECADLKG